MFSMSKYLSKTWPFSQSKYPSKKPCQNCCRCPVCCKVSAIFVCFLECTYINCYIVYQMHLINPWTKNPRSPPYQAFLARVQTLLPMKLVYHNLSDSLFVVLIIYCLDFCRYDSTNVSQISFDNTGKILVDL